MTMKGMKALIVLQMVGRQRLRMALALWMMPWWVKLQR
jgi:hypothetical protein